MKLPRQSDVRRHKPRTGITRASGPGSEQLSLGSVYAPRNDSASSGVRACLYLRETALDMPFGLTTPGGEPVNNSSLWESSSDFPRFSARCTCMKSGRPVIIQLDLDNPRNTPPNSSGGVFPFCTAFRVAGYRNQDGPRKAYPSARASGFRPLARPSRRGRASGARALPGIRQRPRHTHPNACAGTPKSEHFWHRERAQNGPKAEELSASYRVGPPARSKIRASTGMQGVQWGLNYSGQMSQKKRRPNAPRTTRKSNDPMDRLRASQEGLRRAQGAYEQALRKRSEAIREASEVHSVSDVAEALGISRSKVYEILGRFRTAKVASSPEEPVLPW
jgi:hypothetical protein